MKAYRLLSFSIVLGSVLALPLCVSAAPATPAEHDHSHGQESTAAPANTPPAKAIMQQAPDPQFTRQMQRMQEMHEKMMAAKTPDERRKLMGEHMKIMQDGMTMMKKLKGRPDQGGMGMMGKEGTGHEGMMKMRMEAHEHMKMRMDMMEMMMQMMMDQQAAMSMPK